MRPTSNWNRFLAEGLVIAVSILLALAADAWWDGRQDRTPEYLALVNLENEFSQNRRLLREGRAQQEALREAARAFGDIFAQRGDPAGSYDIPDSLFTLVVSSHRFTPVGGALASIVNSGTLPLIQDDSLRTALSTWPDNLSHIIEREARERDVNFDHLVPLLHQYVPYRTLDFRAGAAGIESPSAMEADYRGLLSSLEIENWVGLHAFRITDTLERYDAAMSDADAIPQRISHRLDELR